MVHQFINNGYYILLDVNSGSVHSVDPLVYAMTAYLNEADPDVTAEELESGVYKDGTVKAGVNALLAGGDGGAAGQEALSEQGALAEASEAWDEIVYLAKEGVLFTSDTYEEYVPAVLERKTVVKALCLHVAHDCNLACRYCFAEEGEYHGKRELMSAEVGKKALDFLVEQSGKRRHLEVDFFGGEPLMNMPVVKEIVAYGRELEKKTDKVFRFTITTNGVLLNKENQDYINREMDNVVLSLDGRKEVNDRMRPFRGGKGSYDLIVPKFQEMAESRAGKQYYIRGTFTRNNLDFCEDILHYADLGFDQVSMEPVVCDPKEPYALRTEDLPVIFEQYDKLAKEMLKREEENKGFTFFHFMIDLTGGPCVSKRLSGCGSGTEYLAVTPSGDLYPCHQFVGLPDFLIGNVYDGIVNPGVCDDFRTVSVYDKESCRKCFARFYCSGGCMANAYNTHGSIHADYELGCEMQRKRVECAIMIKAAQAAREGEQDA